MLISFLYIYNKYASFKSIYFYTYTRARARARTHTHTHTHTHIYIYIYICDGVSKSFRTESITKYTLTTINTRWEATQRVMVAKLTRLTHKMAIYLHLVTESCIIYSSRLRRPSGSFWIHPRTHKTFLALDLLRSSNGSFSYSQIFLLLSLSKVMWAAGT
jgi:hypothetical protein